MCLASTDGHNFVLLSHTMILDVVSYPMVYLIQCCILSNAFRCDCYPQTLYILQVNEIFGVTYKYKMSN